MILKIGRKINKHNSTISLTNNMEQSSLPAPEFLRWGVVFYHWKYWDGWDKGCYGEVGL